MNAETALIEKYVDKGVRYGEELIIYKRFCGEFIESSDLAGLAIIGIEGFHLLADGSVQPNMNEIADFSEIRANSWNEYLMQCISAARKVLEQMLSSGESDGYCFILLSADEY